MESRFTENLRTRNHSPTTRSGKPPATADAVEELASVWTPGRGRIIQRSNMDAKLTRISEGAGIAGSKKPKHRAVSGIGDVVSPASGRNDELRTCTQTKQTGWLSKQASVETDTRIGHRIRIGPQAHRW